MPDQQNTRSGLSGLSSEDDPLSIVRQALERLRFGGISLTVHEGKLVQMEITEKRRFL